MLRVLFTLGGPGSGKGTQCKLLSQRLQMQHLSAGELLRRAVTQRKQEAGVIERCIAEGKIVPAEITISLLREAMGHESTQVFLIDGFPRNKDNFDQWFQRMTDVQVAGVLHFLCSDSVLRLRLSLRKEGRSDDIPEQIEKRIATYHSETAEALKLFKVKKIPVLDVNGEGAVETVCSRAEDALRRTLGLQ